LQLADSLWLFRCVSHLRFRLGEAIRLECSCLCLPPAGDGRSNRHLAFGRKNFYGGRVSAELLILFGLYLTEGARGDRKNIQHLASGRI